MSTQSIQTSFKTTEQTLALSITKLFGAEMPSLLLSEGVSTRHPPLLPTFDSWPPASHKQIAH